MSRPKDDLFDGTLLMLSFALGGVVSYLLSPLAAFVGGVCWAIVLIIRWFLAVE